jgi:hypothetical protein
MTKEGARAEQANERLARALSSLEAIVIKYERLAAGGTHHDLPGNGQETDTNHLYL